MLSAVNAQGVPRPTESSPPSSNGNPGGKPGTPEGCTPFPSAIDAAICRYQAESVSSRSGPGS